MARSCTVQAVLTALALSLLPGVHPARAQTYTAEAQRTVEWYATHPAERERVRRTCLNDPGHLERTPDCINAKQGDLEAATSGASKSPRAAGGFLAPLPPSYWASHPNERSLKLAYCKRMPPAEQTAAGCDPVFESLGTGQGGQ